MALESQNYENVTPVEGSESDLGQVETLDLTLPETTEELSNLAGEIIDGYPENQAGEQVADAKTALDKSSELPPDKRGELDKGVSDFESETGERSKEILANLANEATTMPGEDEQDIPGGNNGDTPPTGGEGQSGGSVGGMESRDPVGGEGNSGGESDR